MIQSRTIRRKKKGKQVRNVDYGKQREFLELADNKGTINDQGLRHVRVKPGVKLKVRSPVIPRAFVTSAPFPI